MTEPIEPAPPLATGGMSKDGTTTIVTINRPELDPADKKVLCSAICKCNAIPSVGVSGQSLKQSCVSNRLKALDSVSRYRSPYKAEVTYDMTKRPPAPIMDKEVETMPRKLWKGWTKTLWPKDPERPVPYEPGVGYTRRPDVVIVKDPTKPPTQDNIKKVVEIKFPGDAIRGNQMFDYERIAGDKNKAVRIGPKECDCALQETKKTEVPVEKISIAAAAAMAARIAIAIITRRPPPPVPGW